MSKYSKEFKEEAIRLSDEIGNKKAAAQLGIPYYTLADWRKLRKMKKSREISLTSEEAAKRISELERENQELKQANDILKDALVFFCKRPEEIKTSHHRGLCLSQNITKRIHNALYMQGISVSRSTVYRAMKENGLLHQRRRPHGITRATTEIQEKENIINSDFYSDKPLVKLLTDITEIQSIIGEAVRFPYNGLF